MNEPKAYTNVEGGHWLPWSAGPIDGRALRQRVKVGGEGAVVINDIRLHALRMDDGREWDCINGWREARAKTRTPEMEQAIADVEAWSKEPVESADGKLVSIHRRSTIHELSQAYAKKVWAGQSVSLPYGERWYRVKVALEAQGMSMDGVVLK